MTRIERWERLLKARHTGHASQRRKSHPHHVDFSENDPLLNTDIRMHHISDSKQHSQDAFSFNKIFPDDPATKVGPVLFIRAGHGKN
jgi:hypothetical protein